MIRARFRFYAQLNDFLPRHLRQCRFSRAIQSRTSVKDAIEGLGVPHTEVDLILLNGEGSDFGHQLRDGDDVAVYPAFRSIDARPMRRAGSDAPRPVRFAIDVHLGKLASLLRLAGFDAVVLDDDAELAVTAAREARVVLTRDVGVLKRTIVQHGHYVRHTAPESQLSEILERFELVDQMAPFTRCLRCNTPVNDV